ncbi:MAG: class I SAM-dependent methyltransferase [Acidobacteria bacterium]|nr:class I SAM-dependent methyltransferase [Acidobacteriota bacterium]
MLNCRFCAARLTTVFVDLGSSPLSNAFLEESMLGQAESHFPLVAYVCDHCLLVQLPEAVSPVEIFSDYAYYSSYSDTWLDHAKVFAEESIEKFGLGPQSQVIEIASNDGYLLRNFVAKGIPVVGIEPAANVAEAARAQGVPTIEVFFGSKVASELAEKWGAADLVVGNNVLAHVPALNDFVEGLREILKPQGILVMEFPHLLSLIRMNQFDTIYHEHFSYFSFLVVEQVFAAHGLEVFDVDRISTHGGSLRVFCVRSDSSVEIRDSVMMLKNEELTAGLGVVEGYSDFGIRVRALKRRLLSELIRIKESGSSIVGYGAPAKANTLLNYCGIRTDFIDFTVDRNPHKQGRYLPGSRIPVEHPDRIRETRPGYLLILPWNLKDEIMEQMSFIREWGGKFILPIPEVEVLE